MPTLAWRAASTTTTPPRPVVVMASRFEVRRHRDVPRFLIDSLRIRQQVLRAHGSLGVSLVARPLKRQFLTLSAWIDNDAVNTLVRDEPHRSAMRRHHAVMTEAKFTFWEVDITDLPIDWHDARHRLDAEPEGPTR